MRPGMWTSSAPGDVEDMIKTLDVKAYPAIGTGTARFTPADGYGDRYFGIYTNGLKNAHIFVEEGTEAQSQFALSQSQEDMGIHIEDLGDWATEDYDPDYNAVDFELESAKSIRMDWRGDLTFSTKGDHPTSPQLTNIELTGLKRFTNCSPINNRPQIGELNVTISNSGSVRTVNVYKGNLLAATGFRTGDGTINLTPQNDLDIGGSINITYTGDVAFGVITIEAHWPVQYNIHYSTSALVFPRTPEAVLYDDGRSNIFSFVTGRLQNAGTYNCAILQVSDTNVPKTTTTQISTVVMNDFPSIPLRLAYKQGDSTNTVIRWTAPDASYTYNVYVSALDGAVDMSTIAVTVGAGSGERTATLPTLGAGVTGKRLVIVRSVDGGIEEKNSTILELEYDTGVRVTPRPNSPTIGLQPVVNGDEITVQCNYNNQKAKGMAIFGQLFVWPYADGPSGADYANPDDEDEFPLAENGNASVSLSASGFSKGWYYVGVRAATLDGTQDTGTKYALVWVSTDVPNDVDDFTVRGGRA